MQVAACEQELQWGAKELTRRMVLIATDGTFHMAGEGRFGGIAKPNDAKCHLANNVVDGGRLYDKSLELDYPTVHQVYQRLQESNIQPIFAIAGKESTVPAYEAIVSNWDDISATLGELDGDSSNIIDLIQRSYDKITSKVQLNFVNLQEGIHVSVKRRDCPSESNEENVCVGVKPGTRVSFDVTVTATSCKNGNKSKFELSASSFGRVQVELDIICKCDCESSGIPDSPRCNGNGSLVCGNCECDEGWLVLNNIT
ncbi:Hypothetical predicted protein [Paramuricea clavata]|uniref:Integrin beta n=1 Tax=Paramuricea clavata TaxID=317549 RepID=A0A6S7FS71_PARCT|nr:Hypothetical predicted protein [Paramuricea clavata]